MNGFSRGYQNGRRRSTPAQSSSPAEKAAQALGASPDEMKKAASSGDVQALTSRLSPQQLQQLQKILSDESATKRLLATPQAQALLKSLRKDE